jgi:serine/threonine protein kinase
MQVQHPCLVRFFAAIQVSEPRPQWLLLMEYCSGGTLRRFICASRGGSHCSEAWMATTVRLSGEMLLGLGHLHKHGMVHRDLKPENVLLTAHDHCKIGDLGSSRLLSVHPKESTRSWMSTKSEARLTWFVGSPGYMAPEVRIGGKYDTSADIFSWGVVTFELCTGYFPGGDSFRIMPAPDLQSLLDMARHEDPCKRLQVDAWREHAFFRGVDWDMLLRNCEQDEAVLDVPERV